MPGEPTADPAAAPVTPESVARAFTLQPIVASMEGDRFCHGCGYNLRGQPARRETLTQVLLVRCPECGKFEPANEPRPWIGRAGKLLSAAMVLASLATLATAMLAQFTGTFILFGLSYDAWGRSYGSYRSSEAAYIAVASIVLGVIIADVLGAVICQLAMALMPHWRRGGYLVFALVWPVLPAASVAGLVATFSRGNSVEDGMALIIALIVGAAVFMGGLIGWLAGRAPARLIVKLVLPPSMVPYLGYLWTSDGLDVPIEVKRGA